jgi:HAD superfamily hydrolase (TIGR01549 family)
VLIDLDDTLIEEEGHARAVLRSTATLAGVDAAGWDETVIASARSLWHASPMRPAFQDMGIASWEGLWATFEGAHRRLDGLAEWAPVYRRAAWRAALERAGADPGAAPRLAAHYIAGQRAGHPVLPGAVELVRQLAARTPVAVVTNGPPDIQRLKLAQLDIEPYISAVVISGEVGVGKPDPAIFALALERLGADPTRALMIGDNWERDVQGARAMGMRAVWISGGRPVPDGADASDAVQVAEGPGDVAPL